MSGRFTIALWIAISIAVAAHPAALRASDYQRDQFGSESLTRYLHEHRLPLVGAQVMRNADGDRQVLLYGFVATPFGRSDAETKARKYLKEPGLAIINRITIKPELLTLRSPRSSSAPGEEAGQSSPDDAASQRSPDADAYQQQQAQQYLNQNRDPFGPGFSFGFGFGSGGGGFGFGAPMFP